MDYVMWKTIRVTYYAVDRGVEAHRGWKYQPNYYTCNSVAHYILCK